MVPRALVVLCVLTSIQCGIDENGLLETDAAVASDGSSFDGNATDGAGDGGNQLDAQSGDALPDVPSPPVEAGICDEDANYCQGPTVPSGWSPVAYAENPATSCPTTGWPTQDDYLANVQDGTATCGCGCTKTGDPNCTTGKVSTFFSDMLGCGQPGQAITFNDGGCVAVNGNIANYYSSTALAPTGTGSCTSQAAPSGNLATTPARTCTPDSKCTSATCAGTVPSGWLACIVADGDQACPSGSPFAQKHAIAKSATFGCAQTCGCNVTGTCDSPQVHMFNNGGCANPLVTLASDGTCVATNNGNTFVASMNYTATPNFKCNATGSSAVQVQPTTPKTVCCR